MSLLKVMLFWAFCLCVTFAVRRVLNWLRGGLKHG